MRLVHALCYAILLVTIAFPMITSAEEEKDVVVKNSPMIPSSMEESGSSRTLKKSKSKMKMKKSKKTKSKKGKKEDSIGDEDFGVSSFDDEDEDYYDYSGEEDYDDDYYNGEDFGILKEDIIEGDDEEEFGVLAACRGDEEGEISVDVQVHTDRNPEEISWKIVDANKPSNILKQKKRYQDSFRFHSKQVCLREDMSGTDCYKFIISDSGGDGLTDYESKSWRPDPFYKLLIKEGGDTKELKRYRLIKQDRGKRYSSESIRFGPCREFKPSPPTCVGRTPMRVSVKTDDNPQETSWKVRGVHGNIIQQFSNYRENDKIFYHTFCVKSRSCPVFIFRDSGGDGFTKYWGAAAGGYDVEYYDKRTKDWKVLSVVKNYGRFKKIKKEVCIPS